MNIVIVVVVIFFFSIKLRFSDSGISIFRYFEYFEYFDKFDKFEFGILWGREKEREKEKK
jgi:hypothetical protein